MRAIDEARHLLRRALGLDEMFIQRGQAFHSSFDEFDESLRSNRQLGEHINGLRPQALDNLNAIRDEIGLEPLKRIGTYYHDAPITIRIEHDRATLIYRWTFLSDPQPRDRIYAQELRSSGTCIYEGTPPCLD